MPRGGKRAGAGRPKGSGKYKEPTKPLRVPISKLSLIEKLIKLPINTIKKMFSENDKKNNKEDAKKTHRAF